MKKIVAFFTTIFLSSVTSADQISDLFTCAQAMDKTSNAIGQGVSVNSRVHIAAGNRQIVIIKPNRQVTIVNDGGAMNVDGRTCTSEKKSPAQLLSDEIYALKKLNDHSSGVVNEAYSKMISICGKAGVEVPKRTGNSNKINPLDSAVIK